MGCGDLGVGKRRYDPLLLLLVLRAAQPDQWVVQLIDYRLNVLLIWLSGF